MTRHPERDYGWLGRLGVGTPQANPTVEAEIRRLLPVGVEYCTLRLTSESADPQRRLHDYLEHLPAFVARYAGLELDAFLFACTGSSYLVEPGADREYARTAAERLGAPVILAADAIADWLRASGAVRIALLSPYPDWLNEPAVAYWERTGFEVVARAQVPLDSDDTTGIYTRQSAELATRARELQDCAADAFVISGTGLPSLPVVRELQRAGRPVVSSNLALATAGLDRLGLVPTPPETWLSNPRD